jgi:hypothetical protein
MAASAVAGDVEATERSFGMRVKRRRITGLDGHVRDESLGGGA